MEWWGGVLMPNNSKSSANECKTGPFSLMRKLHEPKSFPLIPRNSVTKYYVASNGFSSAWKFSYWHFVWSDYSLFEFCQQICLYLYLWIIIACPIFFSRYLIHRLQITVLTAFRRIANWSAHKYVSNSWTTFSQFVLHSLMLPVENYKHYMCINQLL